MENDLHKVCYSTLGFQVGVLDSKICSVLFSHDTECKWLPSSEPLFPHLESGNATTYIAVST